MRAESVFLVIFTVCIFLSFYFTYLSFQAIDAPLKKQLVTLAVYSLVTGMIVFAVLAIHLGMKKAISKVENRLGSQEQTEQQEGYA